MISSILAPIFVFAVVVIVHEGGHFLMAKWTGMKVIEFAVGFGPVIVSKKWGETLYSLRLIPLGGFNKIAGMDDQNKDDPRAFNQRPTWAKLLVIVGGALFNVLLALLIFISAFKIEGYNTFPNLPKVGTVLAGSSDEKATPAELKVLHKLIAKEQDDIEHFSFNTTVSAFMIALNDLAGLKCHKREILEPLTVMLSPFTPHIAEELWSVLGHNESITYAHFPEFNAALAAEDNVTYPVSFNGKMRFTVDLPKSLSPKEVEAKIREMEQTSKYVGGQNVVKVIVVPGKIVNFVLK